MIIATSIFVLLSIDVLLFNAIRKGTTNENLISICYILSAVGGVIIIFGNALFFFIISIVFAVRLCKSPSLQVKNSVIRKTIIKVIFYHKFLLIF